MQTVEMDVDAGTMASSAADSVWARLSPSRRKVVVLAFVSGLAAILLTSVAWALQILSGATPGDGILYTPMILAVFLYAVLTGISVMFASRAAGTRHEMQALARLGSLWTLASIPLMFDYLIDSFPGKLLVNALFVVAGIRYWKGLRNGYLPLFLALLTTLIALADGLGHLSGSFCSASGALDACPAKATSDFYLVMLMVGVTAVTLTARTEPVDWKKIALYALILAVVGAAFALAPF